MSCSEAHPAFDMYHPEGHWKFTGDASDVFAGLLQSYEEE